MTTPVDLEALGALDKAATPGPWESEEFNDVNGMLHGPVETPDQALYMANADAALIGALRNNAPALFAELKAARKEIEGLIEINRCANFNFDCLQKHGTEREKIHAGLLSTVETLGVERDALRAELRELRAESAEYAEFAKQVEAMNLAQEERESALEAERDALRAEVEGLKAAYWKGRAVMGFDNDGAEKCDVTDVPEMIQRDCADIRIDINEAYSENDRLEAQLATAHDDALNEVVNEVQGYLSTRRLSAAAGPVISIISALKMKKIKGGGA